MSLILERTEIERFRNAVLSGLGLAFEDGKLDLLAEVLVGRLETHGCDRAQMYLGRLANHKEWREEWRALADRLTVPETYFFRYWDHFQAFADVALLRLFGPGTGPREVRILSAGCASGEEPFSMAILALERLQALMGARVVTILAFDVSPSMIEKALRARYSAWSLRETPPNLRDEYFRAEGRDFILADRVRSMVEFEERNLVEDDPGFWRPEAFDVVFCRNVTMYFSPETTRSVIGRIARALRPGGYLFLGHAETLRGVSDDFHLRHTHDAFYYQKKQAHETRIEWRSPEKISPLSVDSVPRQPSPSLDTSWINAIQHATERITALASPTLCPLSAKSGTRKEKTELPREQQSWDLGAALEFLRSEKFSEAMDLLRQLPSESVTDPDALLLRAVLLTNTGNLSKAEETCSQLLEVDELNAGAHYLMSLCREHAGDAAGAMEHDQTAVYLDPEFAMPRLHLGIMARRSGDREEARRDLAHAMDLLSREDGLRILLFGGGFSRNALVELCKNELRACGGKA